MHYISSVDTVHRLLGDSVARIRGHGVRLHNRLKEVTGGIMIVEDEMSSCP